jgi:NTE family protein
LKKYHRIQIEIFTYTLIRMRALIRVRTAFECEPGSIGLVAGAAMVELVNQPIADVPHGDDIGQRILRNQRDLPAPTLASIPTFSELSPAALRRLEARTKIKRVRRGTVLLRQGDPPDVLYLVVSGRFLVLRDGKEEAVAEIGPGEPLGELAFFAGVRRTANVVAARDSTVLVLTTKDYAEVAREVPSIVSTILAAVAKRLAQVASASPVMQAKPPRTVALLPIGLRGRRPDGFASALAEAMAPADAIVVTPATLSGSASIDDEKRLRDRIARLEKKADVLLFSMDRRDTPFNRACLSFADHLLLVAPSSDTETDATTPSEFELQAASLFLPADRALVIWRDRAAAEITGADKWLAQRDVKLHHHLALDDRPDFERLGRFLSGSALGLVLGGGAALGSAHLGVAKALQEADEPIDFYGGTSVGAAMGAALAMGLKPDEVVDLTEEVFVRNRALRRLTIPMHSLLDHQVFDDALRSNYAGKTIEDLPFNFFAVSASLTSNDAEIHRRGPTWEAVRASTAIPGILPPFITADGDVLVDGAMIDNVPVAVMRKLKLGPNLVVRLKRQRPWRFPARYETFPTRGTILRNLLLQRKRRRYPSLATVLMRSMIMASEQRFQIISTEGDLFLVPEGTAGVGFMDWKKCRRVADAAYRHTAGLLEKAGGVRALIEANA